MENELDNATRHTELHKWCHLIFVWVCERESLYTCEWVCKCRFLCVARIWFLFFILSFVFVVLSMFILYSMWHQHERYIMTFTRIERVCSRSVSCFLFHSILFHSIFHFTWLLWLSSLVAMMLCVCHQQRRTCFIVNDNKYLSYNLDFVYGCQNAVMYVSWQKRVERENEAQRVKGTTMWKLNKKPNKWRQQQQQYLNPPTKSKVIIAKNEENRIGWMNE